MPSLAVWMNGLQVGIWTQGPTEATQFEYVRSWLDSDFFRVLSLSIPLTADLKVRGPHVTNYFDNLLPDNPAIRKRISARWSVRADTFSLLTAIGRDCVGAVQLLPVDMEPKGWDQVQGTPLDDSGVATHLRHVTAPATGLGAREEEDDFRISIAGAQEKTALLRMAGRWCRPEGATPTTHILKLPLGTIGGGLDFKNSVENEWLCAQFLAVLGMKVADTEIMRFEDMTVLSVKRFDRRWIGANDGAVAKKKFAPGAGVYIARLPQEDFCQALGLPADKKYENHGGPSIKTGLTVLGGSDNEDVDKAHFAITQLLFWLLAAPDGHAKNFSLQFSAGGAYHLTPLYDVLSAWPLIGRGARQLQYERVSLAMAIRGKNAHYRLASIQTRHWQELATLTGNASLWEQMVSKVEQSTAAIESIESRLPDDFPAHVYDSIRKGIATHATQFLRG